MKSICDKAEIMLKILSLIINFILIFGIYTNCDINVEYCEISNNLNKLETCKIYENHFNKRYILYDVNLPEGFNLRRDVYIRVAVFVKNLAEMDNQFQWYLVLPPWGDIYHWKSIDLGLQRKLPWGTFFDIKSFQKYIPVIEMYEFLREYPSENNKSILDHVYILQNDENMFKTGKFRNKNEVVKCPSNKIRYKKLNKNEFSGYFWGFSNITTHAVECVVFHGMISQIKQNLQPNLHRSIMFDHMEIPLHDSYGSIDYWTARRSMRYNIKLYEIANEYREKYLESSNFKDKTERPGDWTKEKRKRNALGGPYLSVHLRRRDFLFGHSTSVPTIKHTATQLKEKLIKLNLKKIFLATDADDTEYNELINHLLEYEVFKYNATYYVRNKFKDGGIAIIDQIICSYSRYFIGTQESTFTFRIQEDREILGFPTHTTFNYLCGKTKCSSNGRWEIVW